MTQPEPGERDIVIKAKFGDQSEFLDCLVEITPGLAGRSDTSVDAAEPEEPWTLELHEVWHRGLNWTDKLAGTYKAWLQKRCESQIETELARGE